MKTKKKLQRRPIPLPPNHIDEPSTPPVAVAVAAENIERTRTRKEEERRGEQAS
jgi:hypothetical protein